MVKVAEKHATTWQRIYDKNTEIVDPDVIEVGQKLVIPFPEEELATRPLPAQNTPTAPQNSSQRASSGGGYTAGYCTAFAWSMRPDLPGNLGNANTWTSRARAQGFATGTTPRTGAIGQLGNHVVYVTSVNANGTFNLTEQNYKGLFIVSSRSNVSASGWQFIY